jgi:hypothetical protein
LSQVAGRKILSRKTKLNGSEEIPSHGSDPALYVDKVPLHGTIVRNRNLKSNALFGLF